MDFEKFKGNFGTWAELFKPFIESPQMDEIYKKLKYDSSRGKVICPASKDTYSVFSRTDRNKLRIVWYLQDPYPWIKDKKIVANGIAMDCENIAPKMQPSLELFYEGIKKDVGNAYTEFETPCSLQYLLDQGVMMINTELTTELNKPFSHKGLWQEFHKFFIEEIINKLYPGTIFILSGAGSHSMEKYVAPMMHYVIKTEHPAAAAHSQREWNTNNVFKQVNTILRSNNGDEIKWLKEKVETDLPF